MFNISNIKNCQEIQAYLMLRIQPEKWGKGFNFDKDAYKKFALNPNDYWTVFNAFVKKNGIVKVYANDISNEKPKEFLKALMGAFKGTQVFSLNISKNKCIGSKEVRTIFELLKFTQISELDLSHNKGIFEKGIGHFFNWVKSSQLKCIHLNNTLKEKQDLKGFKHAFIETQLSSISLTENKIDNEGVKHLANALKTSNIHKVDLSFNKIGSKGIEYLGDCFQEGAITHLGLEFNQYNINLKGVHSLVQKAIGTHVISIKLFQSSFYNFLKDANPNLSNRVRREIYDFHALSNLIDFHPGFGGIDRDKRKLFEQTPINNFKKIFLSQYQIFGLTQCPFSPNTKEREHFLNEYFSSRVSDKIPLKYAVGILRKLPIEIVQLIMKYAIDPYIAFDESNYSDSSKIVNHYQHFIEQKKPKGFEYEDKDTNNKNLRKGKKRTRQGF